ncbi:MAG: hypothetical protein QFB86_03975, partial [Patescibacteria group bacterium]|nr:hypothetical protein [Patescibacteria group bacterium]
QGVTYQISYKGGDGNDITVRAGAVNAATAAAASAKVAPKTPDTGFAVVSGHPIASLLLSVTAAFLLLLTARRLQPAKK